VKVVQVGDIAGVACTLHRGLREAGVDSNLLLLPKQPDPELEREPGMDFIRKPWRMLAHAALAGRVLTRYRGYDIFHAHALYNIPMGLLRKLDISNFHGDDLLEVASSESISGKLMRRATQQSRKVLVSTPDLLEVVEGLGVEPDKAIFLPNPVDVELFKPRPSRVTLGNDDTIKLFHPTRFQEKKQNRILFHAYRYLQDKYPLSLYLVHDDSGTPYVEQMHALIKRLELKRVRFLPRMERKLLVDYYNASDIVLDQFQLAMGLISFEAMACGKPVVSAVYRRRKAYPEEPPVFNAVTVEDIVDCLTFLAENREKWEEIGRKGRRWVVRYHSLAVVIRRLQEIYRQVLL